MLRDRETWMTAICYWLACVTLICPFVWHLLHAAWPIVVWPLVAVLAILAMPACLALAMRERRAEGERARQHSKLRAQNRFEEAAEQQGDSFYTWGMIFGGSYIGVGVLMLSGGLVFAIPGAAFGGLFLAGYGLWRFRTFYAWREDDRERRRTSKQRITTATDGLEKSNWDRSMPPR